MTKREKIAISISAIIGFAVFCIALAPIWFLLGYVLGDHTCFVSVEYEELIFLEKSITIILLSRI